MMKKKETSYIGKNSLLLLRKPLNANLTIALILFGVAFCSFGLLSPKLGFYMDDWPYVYYAYTKGATRISEMLFYDSRPYAGWLYTLGFLVLGFKPLYWHLSTLFFRWLATMGMWLLLKAVWPTKKRLANYSALLFIVYPYFLMQPLALGSTHHWVGFALYFFSLFFMVNAERSKKRKVAIILVSLFLEVVHLFTAEYFSGLELLRPLILWLFVSDKPKKLGDKLLDVFKRWLPYFLVLSAYFYWRIVVFEGPPQGDRNRPELLYQLMRAPFEAIFNFIVTILKDSAIVLFQSWNTLLAPSVFDLSSFFTRFVLLVILFSFLVLYFLLNRVDETSGDVVVATVGEAKGMRNPFLVGIFALVLGPLPIWMIGKAIATHTNQMAATRFGLPSMFGAAVLIAVFVLFFVVEHKKQNLVIALLVSLSIGVHLRNSHEYERSWEKQKNLYYQIAERIPALDENTAFIAAGEILFFMGEYPTSYAISTIYHSDEMIEETPYWFASIYGSY